MNQSGTLKDYIAHILKTVLNKNLEAAFKNWSYILKLYLYLWRFWEIM